MLLPNPVFLLDFTIDYTHPHVLISRNICVVTVLTKENMSNATKSKRHRVYSLSTLQHTNTFTCIENEDDISKKINKVRCNNFFFVGKKLITFNHQSHD